MADAAEGSVDAGQMGFDIRSSRRVAAGRGSDRYVSRGRGTTRASYEPPGIGHGGTVEQVESGVVHRQVGGAGAGDLVSAGAVGEGDDAGRVGQAEHEEAGPGGDSGQFVGSGVGFGVEGVVLGSRGDRAGGYGQLSSRGGAEVADRLDVFEGGKGFPDGGPAEMSVQT